MSQLALTCLLFVAVFTQGCHASAELKPTKALAAQAPIRRLTRAHSAPPVLSRQPYKVLPPPKCPLFDVIEKCIAAGKTHVYISFGAMGDDTKPEPEAYHTDPVIEAQTRGSVISPLPDCIVYSGEVYPKTHASLTAYCTQHHYKCFQERVAINVEELRQCCGKTLSASDGVTVVFGDFTYGEASKLVGALTKYATSSRNIIQGYTYGFDGPGTVWKYGETIGTKSAPPTVLPTKFSEALPVCKLLEGDTPHDETPIKVDFKMGPLTSVPDMKMNTPAQELWDYLHQNGIIGPKVRLLFKGRPLVMDKTLGGNGMSAAGTNLVQGIEMIGR